SFSLLIKPTSADCNLRCAYCFYLEKSALYPAKPVHRMNSATLKAMIGKCMSIGMEQTIFSWQGGEPLLMGLDFFREAVTLQATLGKKGQNVSNTIQTNGVLLKGDWLNFFNEFSFLVGLSIDGPQEIYDANRFATGGRSVFKDVMDAVKLLQLFKTQFNVLTVISTANATKAKDVYRFIKSLGVNFHQYIPAVRTPGQISKGDNFSITGEEYGRFLLDLFEEWYPRDTRTVSIRLFDSIINVLVRGNPFYCEMGSSCSDYFVVEYNGDVYPCDFFVEPSHKLGNINSVSFEDLRSSEKYRKFSKLKMPQVDECRDCEFLSLCHGGCTRHRDYTTATSKAKTALCDGLKLFYKETLPTFKYLAQTVAN
ncbi:MAG: anaerobic sulfatase maturase, partial [Fibrobacteres bacterium]|nr:anaerobic sulfatase maturase [Fibrobacterota bacterium]